MFEFCLELTLGPCFFSHVHRQTPWAGFGEKRKTLNKKCPSFTQRNLLLQLYYVLTQNTPHIELLLSLGIAPLISLGGLIRWDTSSKYLGCTQVSWGLGSPCVSCFLWCKPWKIHLLLRFSSIQIYFRDWNIENYNEEKNILCINLGAVQGLLS